MTWIERRRKIEKVQLPGPPPAPPFPPSPAVLGPPSAGKPRKRAENGTFHA
nr:MAG TPA: hypothetical protein [Caudoviricetes sp.]